MPRRPAPSGAPAFVDRMFVAPTNQQILDPFHGSLPEKNIA